MGRFVWKSDVVNKLHIVLRILVCSFIFEDKKSCLAFFCNKSNNSSNEQILADVNSISARLPIHRIERKDVE